MPGQAGPSSPRKPSPRTQLSPLLYDLTSLQREANGRFGFSAKNTLGLAQTLYERHKVLTYPRTDSRALPEDYIGHGQDDPGNARRHRTTRQFAERNSAGRNWVQPNKRIFNNAKISDHFAIIPTSLAPKNLTEPEQKLYDLVTQAFPGRFLSGGGIPGHHAHHARRRTSRSRPKAKSWSTPGWMAVYGREAQSDDQAPRLVAGAAEREGRDREDRSRSPPRPSRRRATRKPRCSRRWKAPANWSKTRNCAKR